MSKLILKSQSELHSHNTRNKNNLCLPKVKRNRGKQRLEYHAVNDWNTLDEETRHSDSIVKFKMNYFKGTSVKITLIAYADVHVLFELYLVTILLL